MEEVSKSVIIVGAGIVGIATACVLAETGYHVTVIDRAGVSEETSAGNAGAFAFSDVLPIASKGVFKKLPKWMLDPLGPFTIRPSYLPRLTPWLYQFWRASRPAAQKSTIEAQVALMRLADREMMALVKRAALEGQLGTSGALEVYESEGEFKAALPSWKLREHYGIEVNHMNAAQMADIQPGLSPRFIAASYVPAWRNVNDPKLFGKALWNYAQSLGANLIVDRVLKIMPQQDGARVTTASQTEHVANHVVVATGAWSHSLAKALGDTIPLDTERGYNTTLPRDSLDLRQQVTFGGHGFVMVPLSTGIRVGGAVEMGGLDLPANFKRSAAMLTKAKMFFPELKTENGVQWMGFRPSIPDGLPVIGFAKNSQHVLYAFGHGHLGLTQSAATARLITDLIENRGPKIEMAPFAPGRF